MLTQPAPAHHTIILAAPSLQPSTKEKYIRAIDNLIAANVNPKNHDQLAAYASGLSSSSQAFLKGALRLLSTQAERNLKASATPDNLPIIQATLLNLEAMSDVIQVQRQEGTKVHIWLSQAQVDEITALPWKQERQIRAWRDYIVIALLVGAGLRREELSNLTFAALKKLPQGDTFRDVLEIHGKGAKDRVVPISPLLGQRLREWQNMIGSGNVARSISKNGSLGDSLSAVAIFEIVREYGSAIGVQELAPHDLRRTFGRLGWEATHNIILIRDLLGHSSVEVTERYIGVKISLDQTASDFIIRPVEFTAQVSGD